MPKRNTEHWQRAARHDYSVHLQLAAQLHLGELHQERQGVIEAKGVTFYNFRIGSGSSWQGVQIKDTDSSSSTDLTMEYGEIVGGSGCRENVHGMGWTAR